MISSRRAVIAYAASADPRPPSNKVVIDDTYGYVQPDKAAEEGYDGFVYAKQVKPEEFFSLTYIMERVLDSLPAIFSLVLTRGIFQNREETRHDDNSSLHVRRLWTLPPSLLPSRLLLTKPFPLLPSLQGAELVDRRAGHLAPSLL